MIVRTAIDLLVLRCYITEFIVSPPFFLLSGGCVVVQLSLSPAFLLLSFRPLANWRRNMILCSNEVVSCCTLGGHRLSFRACRQGCGCTISGCSHSGGPSLFQIDHATLSWREDRLWLYHNISEGLMRWRHCEWRRQTGRRARHLWGGRRIDTWR